jgi:predicted RNase H-like HicB family nuclease
MTEIGFTIWKDGKDWLGYLDEFPDYLTQGSSLSDLQSCLVDLQRELPFASLAALS